MLPQDLRPKESAYLAARLRGLLPIDAAREAGYAHPSVDCSRVEKRPAIARRLAEVTAVRVDAEERALAKVAGEYDIAPLEERRDFLTRVVRGEVTEERPTKDGIVTVVAPVQARIAAVIDLNKQDGIYQKAEEEQAVRKVLDRLRDGLSRDVFVQCLRVLAQSESMPKPPDIDV